MDLGKRVKSSRLSRPNLIDVLKYHELLIDALEDAAIDTKSREHVTKIRPIWKSLVQLLALLSTSKLKISERLCVRLPCGILSREIRLPRNAGKLWNRRASCKQELQHNFRSEHHRGSQLSQHKVEKHHKKGKLSYTCFYLINAPVLQCKHVDIGVFGLRYIVHKKKKLLFFVFFVVMYFEGSNNKRITTPNISIVSMPFA